MHLRCAILRTSSIKDFSVLDGAVRFPGSSQEIHTDNPLHPCRHGNDIGVYVPFNHVQDTAFQGYLPRKTFIDTLLELLSFSSAGFLESISALSSIQKFGDIRPRDKGDFDLQQLDRRLACPRIQSAAMCVNKILGFEVRDPGLEMQRGVTCDQDPESSAGISQYIRSTSSVA